jgi:iron uptake system EfeUOB component EfeO/EfeM
MPAIRLNTADSLGTMKALTLLSSAILITSFTAHAQETAGEKAAEAWDTTKQTAKHVGRRVKHETKKAVHTVREALTPDPDANRVDVKVAANSIDLPKSIPAGKTAFVVTNTGNEKLTFEVEPKGQEQDFAMTLAPNETKVLHVQLEPGRYRAGCVIKGHESRRKEVDLRVR